SLSNATREYFYLAIGGSDVQVHLGDANWATSTGNQSFTGVGFVPSMLMLSAGGEWISGETGTSPGGWYSLGLVDQAGNQAVSACHEASNVTPTDCHNYQRTDKCLTVHNSTTGAVAGEAEFVSFDADGFTINWTAAHASAAKLRWVAITGLHSAVGDLTQNASSGDQTISGLSFDPLAVMFLSAGQAASTSVGNHVRQCFGIDDGAFAGSTFVADDDGTNYAGRRAVRRFSNTASIVHGNPTGTSSGSVVAEAAISGFGSGAFTLDWASSDGGGRQTVYLALGAEPVLIRGSAVFGVTTTVKATRAIAFGLDGATNEHTEAGITSEMTTFVAIDAPIKYTVLKVRNDSLVARRLSATGYVEWVLGDMRSKSGMHIVTEADPVSGALFAKNAYNTEFTGRVAFFNCDATLRSYTGDRGEFLGRNGTLAAPVALRRQRLSGKVGAGLDACAAIQVPFDLLPGQEREIVFVLGVGGRRNADASSLVQKHRGADAAHEALAAVHAHWEQTLGAVRIETPEPELDVLANGWLMYQTIACRIWARSGYYQSGGAFGFRDQLQDAMATIHTQPKLLRDQLLLCAAHQFIEGDVQHWWHPPSDRGVRTHCSDDYLWLPLGAWRYVIGTGDASVLDESLPYLEGRAVKPEEDSYYDLPSRSSQSGTLYDHCVRAIRNGLRFGQHGLPLIGSCDWNDGMDKVGEHGRGESVWLAFFLCEVLQRFAEVADLVSDVDFATECRSEAKKLAANVELNAWDGQWYRRAYFDDGTPLGSHTNEECQIDSISQSWGVLSGAADPVRVRGAMEQVNQRLVRRDSGIIQLLDPPFDKAGPNPGYIRGYVPGVRENGGQYTHAAIWTAMAFARMGDTERAWELARMINPVMHGATAEGTAKYKLEPYVVTADVYAVAPHVGRGGWSWYTGSSGWMYRLILESLLGVTRTANHLALAPRMPAEWDRFSLTYRHGAASYVINVVKSAQAIVPEMTVDGIRQPGMMVELYDTPSVHQVELLMPAKSDS
ncbi:MAG: hypothetical protein V4641_03230, partial [Pseudomonadota bacterium]